MIFPILSAVIGIVAFLPFNYLWILGFVFLVPLFIFYSKENKFWRLIAGTLIFRIIFEIGTVYYALEPMIWFTAISIFLCLPISIFLIKKIIINKSSLFTFRLPLTTYYLLLTALLFTFFDHFSARYSLLPTYIITAGNVFGSSPFLGLANFGGLIFLTFFSALINALIAFYIYSAYKSTAIINNIKKFLTSALSVSILIIIFTIIFTGWIISEIQLNKNASDYNLLPQIIKIGVVSNNENFDWNFLIFKNDIFDAQERIVAEKMIAETLAPLKNELANKNLDLVILPEDMIDIEDWNDIDEEAKNKFNIDSGALLIQAYRNLAKELSVALAATFTIHQNQKTYNTMILFNQKGEIADIYNKSHLTFTSEYWPFKNWIPFYYKIIEKIDHPIAKNNAIFDKNYRYSKGERKNLKIENKNYVFIPAICIEAHYPNEIKQSKKRGANFIVHTSSNRWITYGLKTYMKLINNLRRIESVWLKTPIIFNGRMENTGAILPDGKEQIIEFENNANNKNYGILIYDIKY